MCGIFSLLNSDEYIITDTFIKEQFLKGQGRGPESSKLEKVCMKCTFGFHRLAINGLNPESDQPIVINDIGLICNGEIYNYKELYQMMNVTPTTNSDCEVIIHLYMKYGMAQTLQMLDGVFAFVLCDYRCHETESKLFIARDPYGVRPLYMLRPKIMEMNLSRFNLFGFASEIKCLNEFLSLTHTIEHVKPGTFSMFVLPMTVCADWKPVPSLWEKSYHHQGFTNVMINEDSISNIYQNIQRYLTSAVKKRVLTTERPIACLLSGGLDSSLITALVNEQHRILNPSSKPIETYSIGLSGSEDLKYAKIVADYLGTKHTEIVLNEQDFLDAIPEVIHTIESYDTTTVRASIGNYLLGKYISENSEAKVIFNGDGSDELCGGYLYMHMAPDAIEFDRECRRLLNDIYMFDVLRSDKCISSHGLEPRTPFLDRAFVQYYLSIHPEVRFHASPKNKQCEKFLLRTAFSKEYYLNDNGEALLPENVLWRTKEAFSDGVSGSSVRSLYQIIQEHASLTIQDSILTRHNPCDTDEKTYYRSIFRQSYPNMDCIIPYFWMPKYIEANDASARTLSIYKQINVVEENKCELENIV
jgi:asparagine synthase (glutamine-hydrolysing)